MRILNSRRLYSVDEMAVVLHVGVDYLRDQIKKNQIPYVTVRHQPNFCGWQIKDWLDRIQKREEKS